MNGASCWFARTATSPGARIRRPQTRSPLWTRSAVRLSPSAHSRQAGTQGSGFRSLFWVPRFRRDERIKQTECSCFLMIFRHVDQRAVGVGELEAAVRAFLQELEAGHALGIEVDRLWPDLQILAFHLGQVLLERVDA